MGRALDDDEFYLNVAHALSACQLVEEALKLYITEALELATQCIGAKMPFKLTGKDYANSSLEGLINIFKKLSNNELLVFELNKFKEERNFLSHRGITSCLDPDGDLSNSTATEFQDKLDAIQTQAQTLRTMLHQEANKFRGYLCFNDLTKEDWRGRNDL